MITDKHLEHILLSLIEDFPKRVSVAHNGERIIAALEERLLDMTKQKTPLLRNRA